MCKACWEGADDAQREMIKDYVGFCKKFRCFEWPAEDGVMCAMHLHEASSSTTQAAGLNWQAIDDPPDYGVLDVKVQKPPQLANMKRMLWTLSADELSELMKASVDELASRVVEEC